MTEQLKEQLNNLPTDPGIYKYFDEPGELIYVGKAVNLRNRVRSYFSGPQSPKTQVLVSNIVRLETIVVQSEVDALILEANLIKEHRPRYNIILKDDKSHLYIKITMYEELPRISTCRQTDMHLDPKALYFGPYPSSGIAKQTLRYLRRVFPYLAHHQPPVPGKRRPPQSFFYYNLPLLAGDQAIDKQEYRKQIFQLVHFLEGKRQSVAVELEKQMQAAAKSLDFELAARIKQQLDGIAYVTQRSISPETYIANPELMQEKREEGLQELANILSEYLPTLTVDPSASLRIGSFQLTDIRSGREPSTVNRQPLHRLECYDISNTSGEQSVGSMVVFEDGEAKKSDYRKFKIKRDGKPDDFAMMEEVLARRLKRLHVHGSRLTVDSKSDNSNAVNNTHDSSFSALPDLIIIDGGKGQLSVARTVLAQLGFTIPIVGLTKRNEELVVAMEVGSRQAGVGSSIDNHTEPISPTPYTRHPTKANRSGAHGAIARTAEDLTIRVAAEEHFVTIRLPRGSEALFLIQRIRDEAHRFAITYHRKLRSKAFLPK